MKNLQNRLDDLSQAIATIGKARSNGFEQAFLPEPDYTTIEVLKHKYTIEQGWNNKFKTGYSLRSFGYIVTLK
jgi:hypothetical protein